MAIEIRKREGETTGSFLYRFNKKVQHSGLIKEVRKRQFRGRTANQRKRRLSALYRLGRQQDLTRARKYGNA